MEQLPESFSISLSYLLEDRFFVNHNGPKVKKNGCAPRVHPTVNNKITG
jgi:hypothetical protein